MNLKIPQSKTINLHMCKHVFDLKIYPTSSFYLAVSDMPAKRRAVLGDYDKIPMGNMYDNTLGQLSWR